MTSGLLCESIYAQLNQCGLLDHGSYNAHGEIVEPLMVQARARSIHLKFPPLVIYVIITLMLNYIMMCMITQTVITSHNVFALPVLAGCRTKRD